MELFKSDFNCKIPQTVGAIDANHIFIQTPENERKLDYYCRKQRYSINTQPSRHTMFFQRLYGVYTTPLTSYRRRIDVEATSCVYWEAVVGSNLMFLNVNTGFSGSMYDSRVLKNSSLFHEAEEGNILSNPTDVIEKTKVGPALLGDGGYPLKKWLIKPYTFSSALSPQENKFNKALSSARVVVERPLEFVRQDGDAYLNNVTTVLKTFPMLLLRVLHCITFAN